MQGDLSPAIGPFNGGGCEMSFSSPRNHGDDSRHAELGAFFDCPFHAVEFENGEGEGYLKRNGSGDFVAQFEFDMVIFDRGDPSTANFVSGGDVEFLAYFGAEDSG